MRPMQFAAARVGASVLAACGGAAPAAKAVEPAETLPAGDLVTGLLARLDEG